MTTTSCAPASRWLSRGSAPTRSQNALRRSGVRQYATTRSIDGTAARMHATCVSACQPQPITPSVARPFREVPRGDAARGPGAQLPELVRLDDAERARRARRRRAARRSARRRSRTPRSSSTPRARARVGGRHDGQHARRADAARGAVLDRAARLPAEAALDGIERVRRARAAPSTSASVRYSETGRASVTWRMKLMRPLVSSTAHRTSSSDAICCSRAAARDLLARDPVAGAGSGRSACRPRRRSPARPRAAAAAAGTGSSCTRGRRSGRRSSRRRASGP